MKKIIILGSTGMMGSMLTRVLKKDKRFQILCTYRNFEKVKILNLNQNQLKKINVSNLEDIKKLIIRFKPDYLINCIGLIKQLCNKKNLKETKFLNSTFPKKISKIAEKNKFKIIHLSTDCVFSGKKGNYKEKDTADAEDIYGKSKFNGEVKSKFVINIRTSIIGNELTTSLSLLNWFLKQKKVNGFNQAYFSGLTTLELSNILIKKIILNNKFSSGLFHVSGPNISKLILLKLIKKIYKRKTIINIDNNFKIDRSLNSSKFKKITKYKKKSWLVMIKNLRKFNENF